MAGRPSGTPNKRTQKLLDELERVAPGYDPVIAMAILANSDEADNQLKFQCHKEVAQYVHAKRKAVEATVEGAIELSGAVNWVVDAGTGNDPT